MEIIYLTAWKGQSFEYKMSTRWKPIKLFLGCRNLTKDDFSVCGFVEIGLIDFEFIVCSLLS